MPTILISVDANSSNATAGIDKVASSLTGLDRSMGQAASSSTKMGSALSQQERALSGLDSAQARLESRIIRQNSLFDQAQRAAENYARAQGVVTSGVDTSAAAVSRAENAFTRMISVQERAAMATQATATAYRSLAGAQDQVGRAGTRVAGAGSESTGAGGRGGSERSGMGNFASQFLQYQVGYQLISAVESSISQGFQNSIAMQKSLYGMQATTGISASTRDAIGRNAMDTAASGRSIYGAPVLAQSAYNVASVGITNPAAIKQVTDLAMQSATASGAPDPAPFTAAITGILQSYGFTSPTQVAGHARQASDQAMMAVNLGRMDPKDMPSAVGTFGTAAAHAGLSMSDAFGLFAQNTRLSRDAQQSAQDTFSFVSTVTDPNKDQKRYAAQLGVSDYFGPQAFRNRTLSQWETGINAATQGPNQQLFLQKLMGQVNSANLEMGFLGPNGKSLQSSLGILQQQQGAGANGGATQGGYDAYMKGPAGKYEAAQVQFNTAVQTFATAVTPFATGALALAAGGLKDASSVIAGPGGKGGLGDSARGALLTLGHFMTPGDSGFMNQGVAQRESGAQLTRIRALEAGNADNRYQQIASGRGSVHGGQWLDTKSGKYFADLASAESAGSATGPMHLDVGNASYATPALAAAARARMAGGPSAALLAQTDYGNDVTRRSYASRTRLAGIQGDQTDALTAQRQAGAATMAGALSKGQHIGVSDAQDRLTLALQGFGDKAKALGIYEQAVKDDATISPVKRHLMDLAAEQSVGAGKAGPAIKAFGAGNPDLGGLVAGQNSTAARFGGSGKDPQAETIKRLEQQIKKDEEIIALLRSLVNYARPSGNASPPHPLTALGANRAYKGRG